MTDWKYAQNYADAKTTVVEEIIGGARCEIIAFPNEEVGLVTKVVHCRDVGFDCDGVVRADSEEETLQLVAEHAKSAHGLETVSPEIVEKVKSVMRDEPVSA